MKRIMTKLPELVCWRRGWKPSLVMLSIALLLILSPFLIQGVSAQMKQVIIGGYNGALSNVGINYNTIAGGYTWNATANNRKQVVSTAGTLKNLFVELSGAPGSGTSYTITLVKNDIATNLAVTISDPATTGSDTVNSVPVVAGDVIQLSSSCVGVAATPTARWSVMFEGSYAKESLILGEGATNATATRYIPVSHGRNSSTGTENQTALFLNCQ